jgi:hypothetical protein
VYTDSDEERKYLPQYFKFSVANPLAVRTKVREKLRLLHPHSPPRCAEMTALPQVDTNKCTTPFSDTNTKW